MTLMVQFLVISATQHTPHNKLIDNIVHVIVNTINDVDEVVIYDVGSCHVQIIQHRRIH